MSKQFQIGVLVMTLLVIFMVFGMRPQIRRPDPFSPRYSLLFTQVSGLREGDSVNVSGVPSGFVETIDFASEGERKRYMEEQGVLPTVRVTVSLQRGLRLPEGTRYRIYSNLKGYRWVEIMPAVSDRMLPPGHVLMAEINASNDDQLTKTLKTFKSLNQQTQMMQEMAADPEFRRKVKDTASNMRFYSREFARLSKSSHESVREIDRLLAGQEQAMHRQIERAGQQVDALHARMQTMVPQMREGLDSYRRRIHDGEAQVQALVDQALAASKQFDEISRQLSTYAPSPELSQEIIEKARSYARQLEDMALLAEDMHTLSSDPQVQADLKKMATDLRARAEKLRTQVESWQKMFDGVGF